MKTFQRCLVAVVYWDKATGTYIKVGTAGRTGIYRSTTNLNNKVGATTVVNKSDLEEIVKPTVDYADGSDVYGPNDVHSTIISSDANTVTVKTTMDLGTDSFVQIEDEETL